LILLTFLASRCQQQDVDFLNFQKEGVKVTAKEYLLQIKEQKQNIRKQSEQDIP
jgi:inorganic pyrophosphatase/exopolyphosphatase